MKWSQITDVGRVRTINEDSLCACPEIGLFAVADGMGGHKAGEIASTTAMKCLQENLPEYLSKKVDYAEALTRVLAEANLRVYRMSTEFVEYRGMGTTVTVGLFVGTELIVAHIGDSRAYLIRNNQITQITDDHSLVGEMLRCGGITEEQALNHPQRNVLTRALGTAPMVNSDLYRIKLSTGDRILLCTDGLTNHLGPGEIKEIVQNQSNLENCLQALLNEALSRGGLDNITMILIEV
ncbi:protein serine/threonine phosphatase [Desulfotomaculum nigrificans CO-1-SRB]|uniref:Protein serine/threonine phosphatase n=1 Tax=Desulfotomaculum nigrificans (strain DSM 14880 / VKM B-2319 / CO-1-SRB) TaxID=868595 RepID=F6B4N8_DESCC|nr:Stp1/IreP family PP2C-type Ser/Thr phosphatase [Desulfotomaculum nigrificans]AEF94150.1 protein serine/threonine phosphatase [Desulfotomaculum nigrificans CO-1-SRB]